MSVDRSLKVRDALTRHRNVLTRAERLDVLEEDGRWEESSNSVFNLPKVAHRKGPSGKKTKKAEDKEATTEDAPTAEGEKESS